MDYSGNLPVLAGLVQNKKTDVSAISLFVVQHIKKNTIEFIRLLRKAGFRDIVVVGKPYSVDKTARKNIQKYATVVVPTMKQLERVDFIGLLFRKLSYRQPFLCLDLGGHFSKYFQSLPAVPSSLLGVIEETKNGIWFDESTKLKFPLASVASAALKQYGECLFVARAIIRNAEHILINEFQDTLIGKRILILGFGTIGSHLATILQSQSRVSVSDIKPSLMFKAKMNGLEVVDDLSDLSAFDVIIGITGQYVLRHELTQLKSNVVLINGSTRKQEFDFRSIARHIKSSSEKNRYTKITLTDNKTIRLLAHGYPVNFFETESVPESILDLLYSEMFLLGERLIIERPAPGYYPIEEYFPEVEETVASSWLSSWSKELS